MRISRSTLDEHFDGDALDPDVWFPYYLPHWSSRAESAATWTLDGGDLHLTIPPDQPLWCAGLHEDPLRVSCIQSASFAGPLGSAIGQQPFRDGLRVAEEQPTLWGYTPHYGEVEVRMRGVITPRSMVAFWMSGIEDRPERSGEICVAEIFGDAVGDGVAEVGMGVHRVPRSGARRGVRHRAPADRRGGVPHLCRATGGPAPSTFSVDGDVVRRLDQAPDYPMQLMIGVFDFPAKATGIDTAVPVPELVVSHVVGRPHA